MEVMIELKECYFNDCKSPYNLLRIKIYKTGGDYLYSIYRCIQCDGKMYGRRSVKENGRLIIYDQSELINYDFSRIA
jgi:hypothetical protein